MESLSDECEIQLTKAATLMHDLYRMLLSGKITVRDLEKIKRNEQRFLEITEIMLSKENAEFQKEIVTKTIHLRVMELQAFEKVKVNVGGFIDACQHLEGKTV